MSFYEIIHGVGALVNHLATLGIRATVLPKGSTDRLDQGFWHSTDTQLRLEGSKIDRLIVRFGGAMGPSELFAARAFTLRVGPVPVAMNQLLPMQYHWIVSADPDPAPAFRAELVVKTRGFFEREVVGLRWEGGGLADDLARDSRLQTLLKREIGPYVKLAVEPDEKLRVVRIVHRAATKVGYALWSQPIAQVQRGLPSRALMDALETIAEKTHARAP
jgi:hypothetical protein